MGIISWIILGLLAGAIAKFLLPGRDPGGFIGTTLIGIAGAFIGGWISARCLDRPISQGVLRRRHLGGGHRRLARPAGRLPSPVRQLARLNAAARTPGPQPAGEKGGSRRSRR